MLGTSEFIEGVAGVQAWLRVPGWSIEMLQFDWLHVMDLTIIPECSASCLVELIGEGCWNVGGGTADQKLQRAYVCFIKACKQSRVRSRGQMFSMYLGFAIWIYLVGFSCVDYFLFKAWSL